MLVVTWYQSDSSLVLQNRQNHRIYNFWRPSLGCIRSESSHQSLILKRLSNSTARRIHSGRETWLWNDLENFSEIKVLLKFDFISVNLRYSKKTSGHSRGCKRPARFFRIPSQGFLNLAWIPYRSVKTQIHRGFSNTAQSLMKHEKEYNESQHNRK